MRTLPWETIVRQMIAVLEEDIVPALDSAYLRGQAAGMASLLDNLAQRLEERSVGLQEENGDLRTGLSEVAGSLGRDAASERLRRVIESDTTGRALEPQEENLKLKEIATAVIRSVSSLGLGPDAEAVLVRPLQHALRKQLDRELAQRKPTRMGRLSKGT